MLYVIKHEGVPLRKKIHTNTRFVWIDSNSQLLGAGKDLPVALNVSDLPSVEHRYHSDLLAGPLTPFRFRFRGTNDSFVLLC